MTGDDRIAAGDQLQVYCPGHPRNLAVVRVVEVRPYQADVVGDDNVMFRTGLGVLRRVHRCDHCGMVSAHPDDIANRYCAACNHFCDDPTEPLEACT